MRRKAGWDQQPPPQPPSAIELISTERKRQRNAEGYTLQHDDYHDSDELARAAAWYALPEYCRESVELARRMSSPCAIASMWPWDDNYWKPTPNDRIRELVKAGALIVAEIERLQRLAPSPPADAGEKETTTTPEDHSP